MESRIQDNAKGVSMSMSNSMSSPSSLNNYPESSYNQYYYSPTYNVSPQEDGSNLNYYGSGSNYSHNSQNETRHYYY